MAPQLVPYLIFLHVMGAIVAFGPTFALSVLGAMAGREPQHANYTARQSALISNVLVYPFAILQGITGLLIIWAAAFPVMSSLWLVIAIVLYLIALVYGLTVQRSAVRRLIELTSTPPSAGTPPGPPPAELIATAQRVRRGGMFMGTLIVVIVFLMVVKPQF